MKKQWGPAHHWRIKEIPSNVTRGNLVTLEAYQEVLAAKPVKFQSRSEGFSVKHQTSYRILIFKKEKGKWRKFETNFGEVKE